MKVSLGVCCPEETHCTERGQKPPSGSDGSPGVRLEGRGARQGRFRSDMRKKFFPVRVVRPWPRLPRDAVAAPSLAVLKARMDGALSTLSWRKMSLLMAGGLEPDDL